MPRRPKPTGVRGPNSALTEFLRSEGITDAFRRRQQNSENTSQDENNESDIDEIPEEVERSDQVANSIRRLENLLDEEEREIRIAGRKKRRAARRNDPGFPGDSDDDDDDDDFDYSENSDEGNNKLKGFGEEDTCVDCGARFVLNVYSRFKEDKKGYLCESCNELLKELERKNRRNQQAARRKRKKLAEALLDKSTVKFNTLQDLCIKKITQNIDDVDALGDIGQMNLHKISKILSKNRSLNDSTMTLFLSPNLRNLEFWDCSNIDHDSYNKIAAYCSNLESLTLFMCGQFHNDNLKYFESNLIKLKELSLNGPFLISDRMWQDYFEGNGSNLTKFEIFNTHRFGNDSLISLLENCGSNLTHLTLSRLDGLNSRPVYELIPQFLQPSTLKSLELSYPSSDDLITDDLIINILAIAGETLESLNLDGCSGLTDRFIIEGVLRFCPNLTQLSLNYLSKLSDEAFAKAIEEYLSINSCGLTSVSLTQCSGLGDKAIYSLFKFTSNTLVELNLNSVYDISKVFLAQVLGDDVDSSKQVKNSNDPERTYKVINFPFLTTLDIGFVRSVDNEILELLSSKCKRLSILEIFGNNRCTNKANVRSDLLIIGRQSDNI